jgi:isoleucyl-tRNA synthetase
MFQNLRRCGEGLPESVHFCDFPDIKGRPQGDAKVRESVRRMQAVIDQARNVREKNSKPVKLPLGEMIVVHPDPEFLEEISGRLLPYVASETNVQRVVTSSDTAKYTTVRAEPDWGALGKALGKAMGPVGKALKALSPEDLARMEEQGSLEVAGHTIDAAHVKIRRDFKAPEGAVNLDASGDGDVLVVMDLTQDDSLVDAGLAREVVSRFQQLRKASGVVAGDEVAMFFSGVEAGGRLERVLGEEASLAYFREKTGVHLQSRAELAEGAAILGEESCTIVDGTGAEHALAATLAGLRV